MPKIRHLALATQQPFETAAFYRNAFGFNEIGRSHNGVFLADGTINLAILKFSTDQLGKGMDYTGLHHFGVLVEDVADCGARLEAMGHPCFLRPAPAFPNEHKFRDPDGVVFDIAERPWEGGGTLAADSIQPRPGMPKIRHIAIATNHPEATADFYVKAFGFAEVQRRPDNQIPGQLAHGVFLSDGELSLAILKFKSDQLGKGMDYTGLHHFGILVDDAENWTRKLEAMGTQCFLKPPPGDKDSGFELKFRGPDGVVFDITDHPWLGAAPLDPVQADARSGAMSAGSAVK